MTEKIKIIIISTRIYDWKDKNYNYFNEDIWLKR